MTAAERSEIVEAARSGSRSALAELYRAHSDRVFTIAYRITGSREDAEDVLQDVFVGLTRALGSYDEQGRFSGWLNSVVVRTSLMKVRARSRRREQPLLDVAEPVQMPTDRVDRIALVRALQRLPAALRTVFMLREVEGYSHDDIARELGITAGASATRLSRAWSLLRRELKA